MRGIAIGQAGDKEAAAARPGREAPRNLHEIGDADLLQHALEGHIFSEGHEVLLVVMLWFQAVAVENFNRVIVAWFGGSVGFDARGAGNQRRPGAEKSADIGAAPARPWTR